MTDLLLDDGELDAAVRTLAWRGRVHATGVGKSGIAARFLAESLCAHGVPAGFFHPVDVLHGGLGAIGPYDAVVAVSASGRTLELVAMSDHVAIDVGIYGHDRACELATLTGHAVYTGVGPEDDEPTRFVPSASFLAACAVSSVLAFAVALAGSQAGPKRTHPGGNLGDTRPWDTIRPAATNHDQAATAKEVT